MTIISEDRSSDSPYIETISYGYTAADGTTIRPAEYNWHLIFTREHGRMHPILTGPLPTAGVVSWTEGAEILWIKFKLGTFMPHLPIRTLLDSEITLPNSASQSFYLNGSSWQFPTYENVDTFVDRLVREELVVRDPVVSAALQDELPDLSARTVRHRFLQSTGLTQTYIRQIERARHARDLLIQGKSILDAVDEAGYFDQPHMTRALKQWIGYTPAQIIRLHRVCHSVQDTTSTLDYHASETEMIV
ncbi:MAG: AraC family transcriptional regulator [Anaerolineae bacterium]|nr:AraC family transcriptional regulator [Anaerolineae bacterium]